MHPDIHPNEFQPGEDVYVFEQGGGTYVGSRIGDEGILLHEINFDGSIEAVRAHHCFDAEEQTRIWRMRNAVVEVTYDERGVKIVNKGERTRVWYDNDYYEDWETGEELPKDWRGLGIEFDYLIDVWLRRLNGERIPISEGELDPKYAYLDADNE